MLGHGDTLLTRNAACLGAGVPRRRLTAIRGPIRFPWGEVRMLSHTLQQLSSSSIPAACRKVDLQILGAARLE